MLTQTVLEQIAAQPANLAANLTLTDCNPAGAVAWPIATAGAASPGAGATINVNTGAIDFTQAMLPCLQTTRCNSWPAATGAGR